MPLDEIKQKTPGFWRVPRESKKNVTKTPSPAIKQLARDLNLMPGDIIISEMPYADAIEDDFLSFTDFQPGHTAVWTGEHFERPVAHAVREGYLPPGLKLTGLWEGRHIVFRYTANPQIAKQAAAIIRTWASARALYTKEKYQKIFPGLFWERSRRDLENYFGVARSKKKSAKPKKTIAGPATPYGEPRATFDLVDLERNKKLIMMGSEGLRRAIKFASLRELKQQTVSKKGQRCSPIVLAAFQASILAPMVVATTVKQPFKQYKKKPLLEYADQVLIPKWRETPLGKELLKAVDANDYSRLFPRPFAVDQRYITPFYLYDTLTTTPGFTGVGRFNYFNKKIVLLEKNVENEEKLSFKKGA